MKTRDYSYIFAKAETGEKVLVKVRKSDGVEVELYLKILNLFMK
jgi:hypothetical protein